MVRKIKDCTSVLANLIGNKLLISKPFSMAASLSGSFDTSKLTILNLSKFLCLKNYDLR